MPRQVKIRALEGLAARSFSANLTYLQLLPTDRALLIPCKHKQWTFPGILPGIYGPASRLEAHSIPQKELSVLGFIPRTPAGGYRDTLHLPLQTFNHQQV